MKTTILNVQFDAITMAEAVSKVMTFAGDSKSHMVFTPNPEIVMEARKDESLLKILNSASMVTPDGIGIVLASRLNKVKIKNRVTGYELVQCLFEKAKGTEHTFYFLGGGKGIPQLAKEKMEAKYGGLKIIGVHDGYFDKNEEKLILEEINRLKPTFLLVGLGAPKQEKWIFENLSQLPVRVGIGVGGSFDVMSGKLKRAPVIFQRMGLEWFYRLLKEPWRFKRMLRLPLFALTVIFSKKG